MKVLVNSLKDEDLEPHELFQFDLTVVHDHAYFSQLQTHLTARVSEVVREEVEPSYNFPSL